MKIFNNIKRGVVAFMTLSALSATSCLEFEPLASIGDEAVWSDAANFQLFANQFYSWDRGFSGLLSNGTYCDLRADLVTAYGSENSYSKGTYTVPTSDSNYSNAYKRIYYCNLLLSNAASFGDQESIATPMGEAYFYRAYLHYELLRLYGDAIILTEPLDIDSEALYSTQDPRDDVMDQIVSDMYMAIELLPEEGEYLSSLNKYIAWANLARMALYEGTWQKFHNYCSNGVKDENGDFSYTNFGSYDVDQTISNTTRSKYLLGIAIEASEAVMESGKYQLFYNSTIGLESYMDMFYLDDAAQCNIANVGKSANTEYIHVDRQRDGDKSSYITPSLMINAWVATSKLADMYLCTDGLPIDKSTLFKGYESYGSEFTNRDPRMKYSIAVQGQQYWKGNGTAYREYWDARDSLNMKTVGALQYTGYYNRKWGSPRQFEEYYESMDYPILRYAEVLLTYAEAVFEYDNAISDADLNLSLNLVRGRVGMPSLTNSFASYYELSLREEIRRERNIEFYAEGLRLDDLKRWATAGDEMPGDIVGVQIVGEYAANWPASYLTAGVDENNHVIFETDRKWDNTKHYHYPMSTNELQLNPNLRQTTGW